MSLTIQDGTERIKTGMTTEGMLIPLCVMEYGFGYSQHCKIPANSWENNGITSCPPPECDVHILRPEKRHDCIPYIDRQACRSFYMGESAVCFVNRSDESYSMCKIISPFTMRLFSMEPSFNELRSQCLMYLHPNVALTYEHISNFAMLPIDSVSFELIQEDSCLEMYKYLKPRLTVNQTDFFMTKNFSSQIPDHFRQKKCNM